MADIVEPKVRSRMMSGIRGKHTRPERLVRSHLHRAGLRFSLHRRNLPGNPDIVLSKHRVAVFVNGCFWHRHAGCRFAYRPKSNQQFWSEKITGNVARDRRNHAKLRSLGWRIYVVWECEVRPQILDRLVREIRASE
jgi:DNA mismatch endonuclease (patch repair protein)